MLLVSAFALAQAPGFHGGNVAPRGVPASVTSFGFGGHPGFHGTPASVTSEGFGAGGRFRVAPGSVTSLGFGAPLRGNRRPFEFNRHRRRVGIYSPFYGGYYAPYDYADYPGDNDYADQDVSNEIQAQRVYDDRQQLNNDYRTELNSEPGQQSQAGSEPVSDQPSTVLIFKDGHQLEVANYAIVGATLYDLSDGRSRKIQIAQLDLSATVKENDDRGVQFQLPVRAKLN
jgi:hypothetical protein